MTDDRHGPNGDSGESAVTGNEPGVAAAVPDAGGDRRSLVYLVPPMSAPAEDFTGDFPADDLPADDLPADDLPAEHPETEDWAWVQEWRAAQEPTPWATGIGLAVFSALVVGVAVWVLSAGLADRPVIAVLVNLLVAGGLTPAIWLSKGLPVLRWIAAGAAAGIIVGWISAILMLPLPSA